MTTAARKLYCPKCNMIIHAGDGGASALECPKCASRNLVTVLSSRPVAKNAAEYDSTGIYRAAAENLAQSQEEQPVKDYQSKGIYQAAASFFKRLRPQEGEAAPAIPVETPFIVVPVQCRICDASADQYNFKSHVYYTREKDVDLKPTDFTWNTPEFSKYYPPLYYMWFCPSCLYAANQTQYKEPEANTSFNKTRAKAKILAALNDLKNARVCGKLAENIDFRSMDFFQAIKLHLLGIFILESIDEIRERDALTLAQYHSRLAWLLRDLKQRPDDEEACAGALSRTIDFTRKFWPDLPGSEELNLSRAVEYYERAYERSTVVAGKNIGHVVLSYIARINIKLERWDAAAEVLPSAINEAEDYRRQLTRAFNGLSPDDKSRNSPISKKLKQEIVKLDYFLADMAKLGKQARSLRPAPMGK